MARRPGSRRVEECVLFDVLDDDGTPNSNHGVPALELDGIEGDEAAKLYIEEQDRKIAQMSDKPLGPIKSVTRASRR